MGAELCQVPSMAKIFQQRRCVRAVLAGMCPLLVQKMAISATATPCLSIMKLLLNRALRRPTVSAWTLTRSSQMSQLVTWGELAIIWVPAVPALGPLILIAIALQLIVRTLAFQHFGVALAGRLH